MIAMLCDYHRFPFLQAVILSEAEAKYAGQAQGLPEAKSKDLAGLSEVREWRHKILKSRKGIPLVAHAESEIHFG